MLLFVVTATLTWSGEYSSHTTKHVHVALCEVPAEQQKVSMARKLLSLAMWLEKDMAWKTVTGTQFINASAFVVRDLDAIKKVASPVPVQEHQSLQHEVAGRDLTSKPRAGTYTKRPYASASMRMENCNFTSRSCIRPHESL